MATRTFKVTTFRTVNSPDLVLAFYRDLLEKDGWTYNSDLSDASRASFAWAPQSNSPATVYELTITTTRTNETNVEIKVWSRKYRTSWQ